MQITPDQLANTLAGLLWCGKGRLEEAVERHAQGILDAWDAQQEQGQTIHLADDPEYAALVEEQLRIGREIDKNRRTAAWQRAVENVQAERGGTTDHNASIVG